MIRRRTRPVTCTIAASVHIEHRPPKDMRSDSMMRDTAVGFRKKGTQRVITVGDTSVHIRPNST